MCPQRLFTNTRAIYDRRRAKPKPGAEQPDLAGVRGLGAARPEALPRSHGRQGSRAPWARRGCRAPVRGGRGCLCLGDAEGLQPRPCWGLAWRGCASPPPPPLLSTPQLLQLRRPAPSSQTSIPRFFYLRPGPAKTPSSREKEIHFGS